MKRYEFLILCEAWMWWNMQEVWGIDYDGPTPEERKANPECSLALCFDRRSAEPPADVLEYWKQVQQSGREYLRLDELGALGFGIKYTKEKIIVMQRKKRQEGPDPTASAMGPKFPMSTFTRD